MSKYKRSSNYSGRCHIQFNSTFEKKASGRRKRVPGVQNEQKSEMRIKTQSLFFEFLQFEKLSSKAWKNPIFDYFELVQWLEDGKYLVKCRICSKALQIPDGVTSNLIRHLKRKHPEDEKEYQEAKMNKNPK